MSISEVLLLGYAVAVLVAAFLSWKSKSYHPQTVGAIINRPLIIAIASGRLVGNGRLVIAPTICEKPSHGVLRRAGVW